MRFTLGLLSLAVACGGTSASLDAAFAPDDLADDHGPPPTDLASGRGPACGAFHGDATWNCQADGATLQRTSAGVVEHATCAFGCVSFPYGFDDQCQPRAGTVSGTVNGQPLAKTEAGWVHYAAWCVVPQLAATRDQALTDAARVTWWSLKEGVLDLKNAVGYDNCHKNGMDQIIGPTEVCPSGAAWQVGVAGVQVPNVSLATIQSAEPTLLPGANESALLDVAAVEAGWAAGTPTHDAIVASTGDLRRSWLLRHSVLGFYFQAPLVTDECITQSLSWCYGSGWATSASFAPTKPAALQAIADVRAILDALAP